MNANGTTTAKRTKKIEAESQIATETKADAKQVAETKKTIHIPKPKIEIINIKIVGEEPLVCSKFSEKAKEQMRAKQMKLAKGPRQAKDPWQCYVDSMHWMSAKPDKVEQKDIDKARFGMPSICFKKAAVCACRHVDGLPMTQARGMFYVLGERLPHEDESMVEINGSPEMIESMVRNETGVSDIRYRAKFWPWSCTLKVQFLADRISAEQIVNLFSWAGITNGLGENRAERTGNSWGKFRVE